MNKRFKSQEIKENDQKLTKLLMVSQILPVRTLEIYREQYGEYAGCKRLTPMSDWDNISSNNFDTILSRGVMRIKKNLY